MRTDGPTGDGLSAEGDTVARQRIGITTDKATVDDLRAYIESRHDLQIGTIEVEELLSGGVAEQVLVQLIAVGTVNGLSALVAWIRARGAEPKVGSPEPVEPAETAGQLSTTATSKTPETGDPPLADGT